MTCISKIKFVSNLTSDSLIKQLGLKAGFPDGIGTLDWIQATHKDIPKISFSQHDTGNSTPKSFSLFNKRIRKSTLITIDLAGNNKRIPFETLLWLTSRLHKLDINPIIFCPENQSEEDSLFEKTRTLDFHQESWDPCGDDREFVLEEWLAKFKV